MFLDLVCQLISPQDTSLAMVVEDLDTQFGPRFNSITWKLVRKTESQALQQTYQSISAFQQVPH